MKLRAERWLRRALGLREVLATMPGGSLLRLDMEDEIQAAMMRWKRYEHETHQLLTQLAGRAEYCLDVGGHVGLFTLAMAAVVRPAGRVIVVEANPVTYVRLVENLRINRFPNVTPVFGAAAAARGFVGLETPQVNNVGTTRTIAVDAARPGVVVPSFPLADLLRELGVPRIDVMKIDIEGNELGAFDGLFAAPELKPGHVVFEYMPTEFPNHIAVADRLRAEGYKLTDILGAPLRDGHTPLDNNVWARQPGAV